MDLSRARRVAASVLDPELPVLTLADLGVLRAVSDDGDGGIVVTITPTYTGCPAMETMRTDLVGSLNAAGFDRVRVRTALSPAWTTDWITEDGRRKLIEYGIAPPGPVGHRAGPVPLTLRPPVSHVPCPRCGSDDTEELSRFGATACKALRRCRSCAEPFEHIKEF
ncbi:MAG TPA: 1,2-phenylacetyl-CoA epoxidase subunit PaaD [Pseudonocardiaceae bacterium]